MQSTQLSPAQFMMSYLESEQGKLCKKLTGSSFSRALDAERLEIGRKALVQPQGAGSVASNSALPETGNAGGTAPGGTGPVGGRGAGGEVRSSGNRSSRKNVPQKAKEKVKEDLAFANPALVERVFAQMQAPAEVRQACMNASDSQGKVSLKDLSSILGLNVGSNQAGAARLPLVAANDVHGLIGSLRNRQTGSVASLPQLDIKQSGSYSIEEIREILDSIAEHVAGAEELKVEGAAKSSLQQPQVVPEPGEIVAHPAGVAPDQLERLASFVIPSFSKEAAENAAMEKAESSRGQPDRAGERTGPAESKPTESSQAGRTSGRNEEVRIPSKASSTAEESGLDPGRKSGGEGSEKPPVGSSSYRDGFIAALRGESPQVPNTGMGQVESEIQAPGNPVAESVDSRKMEAVPVDAAADGISSDGEAGEEVFTVPGTDQDGSDLDGGAFGHRESSTSGGDSGWSGSQADKLWNPSVPGLREMAGSGPTAAGTDIRSSENPILFQDATWPQAVSQRLQQLYRDGGSHMTLDIEPEHLGRLMLRIETHHNHVTAYISTETEQARSLLMQNSSSLRQHLADQGLQLGQFSVEVKKDGSGGEDRYQPDSWTKKGIASPRAIRDSEGGAGGSMPRAFGRTDSEQTISLFA